MAAEPNQTAAKRVRRWCHDSIFWCRLPATGCAREKALLPAHVRKIGHEHPMQGQVEGHLPEGERAARAQRIDWMADLIRISAPRGAACMQAGWHPTQLSVKAFCLRALAFG